MADAPILLRQLLRLADCDDQVLDYGRIDGRLVVSAHLVRKFQIDVFAWQGDTSDTLSGYFVRRAVMLILGSCARIEYDHQHRLPPGEVPDGRPHLYWMPDKRAAFAAMHRVNQDWETGDYVLGLAALAADPISAGVAVRKWIEATFV